MLEESEPGKYEKEDRGFERPIPIPSSVSDFTNENFSSDRIKYAAYPDENRYFGSNFDPPSISNVIFIFSYIKSFYFPSKNISSLCMIIRKKGKTVEMSNPIPYSNVVTGFIWKRLVSASASFPL